MFDGRLAAEHLLVHLQVTVDHPVDAEPADRLSPYGLAVEL